MTGIEACIEIAEKLSEDDPEADRVIKSAREELEKFREIYKHLKGDVWQL